MTIPPQAFPVLLIVLDIGAAIVYAAWRDWWLASYWAMAAGLTFCVTFK